LLLLFFPVSLLDSIEGTMKYLFLIAAVIAEVIATSALKSTEEFTRLWPSVIVIVGYSLAFYLLSLTLKTIPVGIAYAIWCGLGIILVSLIGYFYYKQSLDLPAILGLALILAGVLVINLFSKSVSH
jgi:small multidrug resistance pump